MRGRFEQLLQIHAPWAEQREDAAAWGAPFTWSDKKALSGFLTMGVRVPAGTWTAVASID